MAKRSELGGWWRGRGGVTSPLFSALFLLTTASAACGGSKDPSGPSDLTTMSVQYTSSVPAPISGDTYASGCPAVVPDLSLSLSLVAK